MNRLPCKYWTRLQKRTHIPQPRVYAVDCKNSSKLHSWLPKNMLLLHLFTSEERHKKKLKHFFLCVRSLQSTRDGCVLCERQRRTSECDGKGIVWTCFSKHPSFRSTQEMYDEEAARKENFGKYCALLLVPISLCCVEVRWGGSVMWHLCNVVYLRRSWWAHNIMKWQRMYYWRKGFLCRCMREGLKRGWH